jgi:NSS family neurotransmitter:Na+ symporter
VAIGLGNVWRFPYMMGKYGGSAFLFVYLLFTILFAVPALIAEMKLGMQSRKGTVDAMRLGLGKGLGTIFGYFLLCVVTIAGSYYAAVIANVVFSAFFATVHGFSDTTTPLYHRYLGEGWLQYGITLALIGLSLYVIDRGLASGIERISRRAMPVFFLVLIYMIIHALTLPGSINAFKTFLKPDFAGMGITEVFAALGQAFFSVGLGGTFVVTYAGFLREGEDVPRVALFTGFGDAGASLLFSLFLIPSILVFGMDMTSGPTLIFNSFPQLFSLMPAGRFVGPLFLLSISMVAFLSLVAAYEVPFASLQNERPQWNRRKILLGIGVLQAVLALPSSLYPDIIGTLDLVFGSGMQVLGSGLCIIGLTWGLRKEAGESGSLIGTWTRWVIPLALLAVLVTYLVDVLSGK